jgi:hypothetical protein
VDEFVFSQDREADAAMKSVKRGPPQAYGSLESRGPYFLRLANVAFFPNEFNYPD